MKIGTVALSQEALRAVALTAAAQVVSGYTRLGDMTKDEEVLRRARLYEKYLRGEK